MNLFEKHKKCTAVCVGLVMFADDVVNIVMPDKENLPDWTELENFIGNLINKINRDAMKVFNNMKDYEYYEREDFDYLIDKCFKKGFFAENAIWAVILSNTIIYCIAYSLKRYCDNIQIFINNIVRMSFLLYEKLYSRYNELSEKLYQDLED